MSFYDILGVSNTATDDEIKQAYRQKAKESHPDLNPTTDKEAAERQFNQVQEAYEVLKNRVSRDEYDRQLSSVRPMGGDADDFDVEERVKKWYDEGGWTDVRWYTDNNFRAQEAKKRAEAARMSKAQEEAWEAVKVEAELNIIRRQKSVRATEQARWAKAEVVLKNQWMSQKGIQRQDMMFMAALGVATCALGAAHYFWPVTTAKVMVGEAGGNDEEAKRMAVKSEK